MAADQRYKCAVYNHDDVNNTCTDVESCQVYERCEFCFAVYVSTSDNTEIPKLSGCGGTGHKCARNNTGKCVLKNAAYLSHYCCCYGDFCNRNIEIISTNLIPKPTPAKPTIGLRIPKEMGAFRGNNILFYILPPIFGLIILLAVVQRLCKKHKRTIAHDVPLLLTSPPQTPPLQTDPIQFHEVVSRGQFGYVWKALYNHKLVAVKIIPLHERSSWESERNMYSNYKLCHENILSFHSAEKRCQSDVIQYWIITEYHQYGSLADYLHCHILSFDDLMRLALSMISGLVYLHCEDLSASPPKPVIVHMDFKSRNVLVKDNLTCCVSDFGSASAFPKDSKNVEVRAQVGTKRYMAPEMLQGAVAFQAESFLCIDIYALALVLWELVSRFTPDGGPVNPYRAPYEEEVGPHPTIEDMKECVVRKNIRPLIKDEWRSNERLVEYCYAIEDCWDDDGDARLTARCVYERLSLICKEDSYEMSSSQKMDGFDAGQQVELSESGLVSSLSSGYLDDNSKEDETLC